MSKQIVYKAGDLFAVPLRRGGFGVALVTHIKQGGGVGVGSVAVCGFDHLYDAVPDMQSLQSLSILDAIHFMTCGDKAMTTGRWPRFGTMSGFVQTEWPLPVSKSTDNRILVYVDEQALVDKNFVPEKIKSESELNYLPITIGLGDSAILEISLDMAIRDRHHLHYFKMSESALQAWSRIRARASDKPE